ncbi:MAG: tyrosine-protein phosphatase [Christensenellales bacterium]|jgi:protein-tyrosine phosphatase
MPEFESIRNFRDLGGRGPIRAGVIYRSGHLSEATNGDLDRLFLLGIKTVIDLRADRESNEKPDRLPARTRLLRIPLLLDGGTPGRGAVSRIKSGIAGPPKADMTAGYFRMASAYAPSFGLALTAIAESEGAVLFHCQQGKDRTGVLAALLHFLAGADPALILEDYLKTNEALAPFFQEDFAVKSAGMDERQREIMRSVFTAEPEYLKAFFDGIRGLAPTVADYAVNVAGISPPTLQKLLAKLC